MRSAIDKATEVTRPRSGSIPGWTLEVRVADALPVEVGPVEARRGEVDGEAVGAPHLRRRDEG